MFGWSWGSSNSTQQNTIAPSGLPNPFPASALAPSNPLAITTKELQAEESSLMQARIKRLYAVIRLLKQEQPLSPVRNLFAKNDQKDVKTDVTDAKSAVATATTTPANPQKPTEQQKSDGFLHDLLHKLRNKQEKLLLSEAIQQVGEKALENMQKTNLELRGFENTLIGEVGQQVLIDACEAAIKYARQLEEMVNDVLHLISIDENFKSIAEKTFEKMLAYATGTNMSITISNTQDQARIIYRDARHALNATVDTVEQVTRHIDSMIVAFEKQAKVLTAPPLKVEPAEKKLDVMLTPHPVSRLKTRTIRQNKSGMFNTSSGKPGIPVEPAADEENDLAPTKTL